MRTIGTHSRAARRVTRLAATAAMLLAACGSTRTTSAGQSTSTAAAVRSTAQAGSSTSVTNTAAPTTTAAATFVLPVGDVPVVLDPARMSANIDNPYWPMVPGTRWTYREVDANGERQAVVVVTNETKQLANGVTARVVRDTVTEKGAVIEDTIDWFAQDDAGNIWYLGEDTAEFANGKISTKHGSFEAGADGALPGIVVLANPQSGMRYRQEYYKGQAEDNGEVLSTTESVDTALGHFDGVLKTKDTSSIEPDLIEQKYYAKGVGVVLTTDVNQPDARSELVKMDTAPPSAGTGPLGRPDG